MSGMKAGLDAGIFIKNLHMAKNNFITPKRVMEISRAVFGKTLTLEQAREHFTAVSADLRPLYSATLRLLAHGDIREGNVKEVLAFCESHQISYSISNLISDQNAREQYLIALISKFPEKRLLAGLKENPWRKDKYYGELFRLDPNKPLSLLDLPESTEDLKALFEKITDGDNYSAIDILRIFARYVGLNEIQAQVVARIQEDVLFAFVSFSVGVNIFWSEDFCLRSFKPVIAKYCELLSDPKAKYSFYEAIEGLYCAFNNFFGIYFRRYKLYKTDMVEYQKITNKKLDSCKESGDKDLESKAFYERYSKILSELCPHIDMIVQEYGLDIEVDKLPEQFFDFNGERGNPELKHYYMRQANNVLFIIGMLITSYGYSQKELRA